eukprot:UN21074
MRVLLIALLAAISYAQTALGGIPLPKRALKKGLETETQVASRSASRDSVDTPDVLERPDDMGDLIEKIFLKNRRSSRNPGQASKESKVGLSDSRDSSERNSRDSVDRPDFEDKMEAHILKKFRGMKNPGQSERESQVALSGCEDCDHSYSCPYNVCQAHMCPRDMSAPYICYDYDSDSSEYKDCDDVWGSGGSGVIGGTNCGGCSSTQSSWTGGTNCEKSCDLRSCRRFEIESEVASQSSSRDSVDTPDVFERPDDMGDLVEKILLKNRRSSRNPGQTSKESKVGLSDSRDSRDRNSRDSFDRPDFEDKMEAHILKKLRSMKNPGQSETESQVALSGCKD